MFRSSYDHHQVYKSYHVHVLIIQRYFTVEVFIVSSMRATFTAWLIFFDLTITIFSEEYKLRSSSFCSFFQPYITSSLGDNVHQHVILESPEFYILYT